MRIACHTNVLLSLDVQQALKSAGFKCVIFSQESELLAAIRNERFDLVLADSDSFHHQRQVSTRTLINVCGFTLDCKTRQAFDRGTLIGLRPREFELAWLLFSSPGTTHSCDAISQAIWGVGVDISRHTIEQHMYILRKKLGLTMERGTWIKSIYTKGYCLAVGEESRAALQAA